MEAYAPYIALLIIAVGLGGPAIWGILHGHGRTHHRDHTKKQ